MPVTTEIEDEQDKENVKRLYSLGRSINAVAKESGYTVHQVRKFLMQEEVYRYAEYHGRGKYVAKVKEPPNEAYSQDEDHYGSEGANKKYTWARLSPTERALLFTEQHEDLRHLDKNVLG